jgi:hypothetical protein
MNNKLIIFFLVILIIFVFFKILKNNKNKEFFQTSTTTIKAIDLSRSTINFKNNVLYKIDKSEIDKFSIDDNKPHMFIGKGNGETDIKLEELCIDGYCLTEDNLKNLERFKEDKNSEPYPKFVNMNNDNMLEEVHYNYDNTINIPEKLCFHNYPVEGPDISNDSLLKTGIRDKLSHIKPGVSQKEKCIRSEEAKNIVSNIDFDNESLDPKCDGYKKYINVIQGVINRLNGGEDTNGSIEEAKKENKKVLKKFGKNFGNAVWNLSSVGDINVAGENMGDDVFGGDWGVELDERRNRLNYCNADKVLLDQYRSDKIIDNQSSITSNNLIKIKSMYNTITFLKMNSDDKIVTNRYNSTPIDNMLWTLIPVSNNNGNVQTIKYNQEVYIKSNSGDKYLQIQPDTSTCTNNDNLYCVTSGDSNQYSKWSIQKYGMLNSNKNVKISDLIHIKNLYRVPTYLDRRGDICGNGDKCVSASDKNKRDSNSGSWKIEKHGEIESVNPNATSATSATSATKNTISCPTIPIIVSGTEAPTVSASTIPLYEDISCIDRTHLQLINGERAIKINDFDPKIIDDKINSGNNGNGFETKIHEKPSFITPFNLDFGKNGSGLESIRNHTFFMKDSTDCNTDLTLIGGSRDFVAPLSVQPTTPTGTTGTGTTSATIPTTTTVNNEIIYGNGSNYSGEQNKSISGNNCVVNPTITTNSLTSASSSSASSGSPTDPTTETVNNNYCRNTDNDKTIWCYTEGNPSKEYCVPKTFDLLMQNNIKGIEDDPNIKSLTTQLRKYYVSVAQKTNPIRYFISEIKDVHSELLFEFFAYPTKITGKSELIEFFVYEGSAPRRDIITTEAEYTRIGFKKKFSFFAYNNNVNDDLHLVKINVAKAENPFRHRVELIPTCCGWEADFSFYAYMFYILQPKGHTNYNDDLEITTLPCNGERIKYLSKEECLNGSLNILNKLGIENNIQKVTEINDRDVPPYCSIYTENDTTDKKWNIYYNKFFDENVVATDTNGTYSSVCKPILKTATPLNIRPSCLKKPDTHKCEKNSIGSNFIIEPSNRYVKNIYSHISPHSHSHE